MNLREISVIDSIREVDAPIGELRVFKLEIVARSTKWVNLDAISKLERYAEGITIIWLSAQQNVYAEGEPGDVANMLKRAARGGTVC